MWRDRILEAKKAKGIATKSMADYSHMTEKTVARILSGETQNPYVDNVIVLGASVGLTPSEIFSESGLVVGDQNLAAMQAEVDLLTATLEAIKEELTALRSELAAITAERDILQLKLDHKEELIKHKDEILALLRRAQSNN